MQFVSAALEQQLAREPEPDLLHVDPQARQMALAKLQSDDLVEMAQPIDGAVQ